jgi:vacuolar-type H+-ATPase subunit H
MIQDPANRINIASLRLKEAKQDERQTIREFVNHLEDLEEDILEILYEQ